MKQALILLFMILQFSCSVKQTSVKKVRWTDDQVVSKDAKRMEFFRFANGNISAKYVIRDLDLPAKGGYGSSIKWSIPKTVKVARVNLATGQIFPALKDEVAILRASFSKGKAVSIRDYKLTIKARYPILISFDSAKQPYIYFSKNGDPWQQKKMKRKNKNWWKWQVLDANEMKFKFSLSPGISSDLKESYTYRTSSKNCYGYL